MQLLLRADLATLLDRDQTPPWLLTTLLGGHVRVSAETARKLIDQRGADLRTVILDDTGSVLGVGRRARIAPDWLKDTTLALHNTCTTPGCDTAARHSDTDHAHPWHPARPHDPSGRTDIELGPSCPRHNHTKERDGWTVTQHTNGTRRWHHPLRTDHHHTTHPHQPAPRQRHHIRPTSTLTCRQRPPPPSPAPPPQVVAPPHRGATTRVRVGRTPHPEPQLSRP